MQKGETYLDLKDVVADTNRMEALKSRQRLWKEHVDLEGRLFVILPFHQDLFKLVDRRSCGFGMCHPWRRQEHSPNCARTFLSPPGTPSPTTVPHYFGKHSEACSEHSCPKGCWAFVDSLSRSRIISGWIIQLFLGSFLRKFAFTSEHNSGTGSKLMLNLTRGDVNASSLLDSMMSCKGGDLVPVWMVCLYLVPRPTLIWTSRYTSRWQYHWAMLWLTWGLIC